MESEAWRKYLPIAEGYFELGMPDAAEQELKNIPDDHQGCNEVLALRVAIHTAAKKWKEASEVARLLVASQPENAGAWISYAYATRRAESISDAEAILRVALKRHPNEPMIRYNLACYTAQTDRLDEARELLATAVKQESSLKLLAEQDPDLQPLRGRM